MTDDDNVNIVNKKLILNPESPQTTPPLYTSLLTLKMVNFNSFAFLVTGKSNAIYISKKNLKDNTDKKIHTEDLSRTRQTLMKQLYNHRFENDIDSFLTLRW